MNDPYLFLQLCVILSTYGSITDDTKTLYISTEPVKAAFYKINEDKWVGSVNQSFFYGTQKGLINKVCDAAFKDAGLPVMPRLKE